MDEMDEWDRRSCEFSRRIALIALEGARHRYRDSAGRCRPVANATELKRYHEDRARFCHPDNRDYCDDLIHEMVCYKFGMHQFWYGFNHMVRRQI